MSKFTMIATLPLLLVVGAVVRGQTPHVLHFEGFERGGELCRAEDAVWEFGRSSIRDLTVPFGDAMAGTVLSRRPPADADARLVYGPISLPAVLQSRERVQLRFWTWSHVNSRQTGVIEVRTAGQAHWQAVTESVIRNSLTWTQYVADLTQFAGSEIEIAFHFSGGGGNGWYIDDISVELSRRTLSSFEDFETGIGDWYADGGVWQVGRPTFGLRAAYSGQNVIGTNLGGRASAGTSSRLVSPPAFLPPLRPGERLELTFQHWSHTNQHEEGFVEIIGSRDDCGREHTISRSLVSNSRAWNQHTIDISEFAGSTVRIAFRFSSHSGLFVGSGWFIDDVDISVVGNSPALPIRSRSGYSRSRL